MIEIGKRYYIVAHAYFHYVGEVMELTPRQAKLRNCVQVHSCKRNWTRFFAEGFGKDTTYDVMPDGIVVPVGLLPAIPWNHEIPTSRKD